MGKKIRRTFCRVRDRCLGLFADERVQVHGGPEDLRFPGPRWHVVKVDRREVGGTRPEECEDTPGEVFQKQTFEAVGRQDAVELAEGIWL